MKEDLVVFLTKRVVKLVFSTSWDMNIIAY